jgi:hypothetical protein
VTVAPRSGVRTGSRAARKVRAYRRPPRNSAGCSRASASRCAAAVRPGRPVLRGGGRGPTRRGPCPGGHGR